MTLYYSCRPHLKLKCDNRINKRNLKEVRRVKQKYVIALLQLKNIYAILALNEREILYFANIFFE
jgi:hypothetical protein